MIDPRAKGHEAKIVEYVVDQVKKLKADRSERESRWRECIRAYLCEWDASWIAKSKEDGRSTRYLGLTWDAVENVSSQMAGMLFPNEDWFKVEPGRRGGLDPMDDAAAPHIEVLLKRQHRQMHFRTEFLKLLKWLVVTGNCPWTMVWDVEQAVDYPSYARAMGEWVEKQQVAFQQQQQAMLQHAIMSRQAAMAGLPVGPPPQMPVLERPVGDQNVAYAGPRLYVGDPFNFVIDTGANDERRAFRASTFWRSKAYLLKRSEPDETGYTVYEDLDKVHDIERQGDEASKDDTLVASMFGVEIPTKQQIKLVEAQGDIEIEIDNEAQLFSGYICTIANDATLVRFEESHLWSRDLPTGMSTLIPIPGQVYGVGLVEMSLGTQDAINVRSNQMIDAVAVAINPETKVIDDGIFDPLKAESGPGAMHVVGTLDNIQPIIRDLSGLQLSFSEIGQMKGEFQQLTRSANPFTTQSYKKSATEIARDSTVSGTSLQEIAKHIEEITLAPILRMQLQFNQQYMAEDVKLRVVQNGQPSWENVSPQSVRLGWDVNIVGSQNQLLKDKRLTDLLQFFQMASGNPMTLPYVNVPYLMRVIYQEMGFTDADQVFMQQPMGMGMDPMMGGPGGGIGPGGPGAGGAGPPGVGGAGLPAGVPADVAATAPYARQAVDGISGGPAGMG